VAGTYESKECATAVTKYCVGNTTADVNFCSAAPRGTLDLAMLRSNQTAAAGVSGFLAAMCMPASSSTQMDACACFTVRLLSIANVGFVSTSIQPPLVELRWQLHDCHHDCSSALQVSLMQQCCLTQQQTTCTISQPPAAGIRKRRLSSGLL
jgi:hypothetical protein